MAQFTSKTPYLALTLGAKYIEFKDGKFVTTDASVINTLRKHPHNGELFSEVDEKEPKKEK